MAEQVYVSYGAIGAVKMGWLSATMTVKMPDGSDARLKVPFSAIASGQRDEARNTFGERGNVLGEPVTEEARPKTGIITAVGLGFAALGVVAGLRKGTLFSARFSVCRFACRARSGALSGPGAVL